MTYCVGIKTNHHTILISDSRTSAGVDNISQYSKMWQFGVPGERQFVLCSAGNLATTQAVVAALKRDMKAQSGDSLLTVGDMHAAAAYVGRVSVDEQQKAGGGAVFEATFLLAGEIKNSPNGMFMIYAQGNFIENSPVLPFLQLGEAKYGKPILDQVVTQSISLEQAVVTGLISMDQTVRSNLTVGPPIELYVLEAGNLSPGKYQFFDEHNDYLRNLRDQWNGAMVSAMDAMPRLNMDYLQ